MNTLKLICLGSVAALVLSGCATDFPNPKPDFTKKGSEAQAELKRFHVDSMNSEYVVINKETYHTDGIRSLVQEISPEAEANIKRADTWFNVDLAFCAAAIIAVSQPRGTWGPSTGYWLFFGAAVGSGVYSNSFAREAGRQFNRDLEAKFAPQISASFEF